MEAKYGQILTRVLALPFLIFAASGLAVVGVTVFVSDIDNNINDSWTAIAVIESVIPPSGGEAEIAHNGLSCILTLPWEEGHTFTGALGIRNLTSEDVVIGLTTTQPDGVLFDLIDPIHQVSAQSGQHYYRLYLGMNSVSSIKYLVKASKTIKASFYEIEIRIIPDESSILHFTPLPPGTRMFGGGGQTCISPNFLTTGSMSEGRAGFTATLLQDGRVLVAGGSNLASAELYNPASGTWTPTGSMHVARYTHRATLLQDGRVLVAGGHDGISSLASAEIYDPATGTWTYTGSMNVPRYHRHLQVLLPNGMVLVAGGYHGSPLSSAELYNPATGTWTNTGNMNTGRYDNAEAILLPNGKVLVAGGYRISSLASAELYDPSTGNWNNTGSMNQVRSVHSMTLLAAGEKVLAVGGTPNGGSTSLASTELYNISTGTWNYTGSMSNVRRQHTTTLIPSGQVLVSGGYDSTGDQQATAELYDSTNGVWSPTTTMGVKRAFHETVLLTDGRVLVVGGYSGIAMLSSAEIFVPCP